ncbi:unnamed protein product [Haemonchus placei]|uniref:Protein kinase domain-containing protein n=1 Tax=Haemonchus placei TaxID=6290 RepID=A0A0N4WL57_HAEPC|nr:unnamed protein product [Haemonchus placei]
MSEEEEDDLGIKPGTVIDSSKARYVIVKLLGEGGFGAVYKVYDEKDPKKEYAMKVEKKLETRPHSKLKMEIAILKLVSAERKQSHFTAIIDRGKKDTYFFLVMELVGKSLADLKRLRPKKVFSISTAMGVGIQCLEACEDLHKHGFIHRDLKPANYACGLGDKQRVVCPSECLALGKKDATFSRPFKGTIKFASIACHKNAEMGPKDDCESWFYLVLDITMPKGNAIKKFSDAALSGVKCKEELSKVLDYIDTLKYSDHVDYEFIYKSLTKAAKTAGGDINQPYDWEKPAERSKISETSTGSQKP